MKSETINSFSEGLALDVNELNTSNKIMTDALNATLLTYNGNEFSLQNDMGNVAVGSAYLSKGYVPVGMKEHGGIIYVASHNPETKKGQIGCFPSPQQLYGDQESDFTSFSIDLSNILSKEGDILYINHEFYREDLFVPKNNNKARELHPGDEFIVACDLTNYLDLLKKGILKFKLASVGKDGVINYIDDKDLKLYNDFYTIDGIVYYTEIEGLQEYITIGDTKYYVIKEVGSQPYIEYNGTKYHKSSVKTWIYNSKSAPAFNSSLVQVFPGNTSGKLMIIVEYNVFDDFNLTWKYNIEGNEVTNAVFEGTATQSYDKQECKTIFNIDKKESGEDITIATSEDNKISYKIAPYSEYGIHKKLIKEGTIDVEELMKNSNGVIDSWNYYVGNDKIEIYWGFNYLNINGEEIDKMRFVFIPIEDIVAKVPVNNNAIISIGTEYEIKYIKIGNKYYEAVNGHIEIDNIKYDIIEGYKKYINYRGVSYYIEYVNIDDQYYKVIYNDGKNAQITPDGQIYLFNNSPLLGYTVEIEKPSYIGSFEDTFIFNDRLKKDCIYVCRIDKHENNTWTKVGFEYVYTSTFFNNKTAQEIKNYKNNNRPEITVNIDVSYNIDGETYNQNHIKTESFIQNNMGDFINNNLLLPLYVQNPSETNTYGFLSGIHRAGQFNLKEAIDVSKTGFDGNYNHNLASSIIGEIYTGNITSTWETTDSTSYTREKYSNNSYKKYLDGQTDAITISDNTINYSLYRLIYAPAGPIDIKELSIERLRPAYEDENDFDNLFAFKYNQNNQLLCVGAEDEDMRYNTVIRGTVSTTEEDKGTALFKSNSNISPDDTHYSSALNSMRSGKPGTIGILAGISSQSNGADAQLCFSTPNGYIRTNEINGWEVIEKGTTGLKIYPVDEGQNYLIASWKGSEGRDYLINVMSRKTDVKKVDYYMKVLLSQLLIAKNKKEYIRYTAPNPNQYNYSLPEDSVFEFKLTVTTFNPILKYADINLESLYELWDAYNVKNYLPELKYTINNKNYNKEYTDTFEVKIGGDIEIDSNLLNLYVNSYNLGNSAIKNPNPTDNTLIITDYKWRQNIYRGSVQSISNDGICKLAINENTGNYTVVSRLGNKISQLKTNSQEIDDNVEIFQTTNLLTTRAKLNLVTEKIPEGWYNEILLDESYIKDLHSNNNAAICEGVWIYGGITNAPDLLNYIYLGDNTTRFDNTKQIQ